MAQQDGTLLLKLARQAAKDPDLLAGQIDAWARNEPGGWPAVAARLQIDECRLAKLALCRRPASRRFEADVQQIAGVVNVDPAALTQFLNQPAARKASYNPASVPKAPLRATNHWRRWPVGLAFGLTVLLVMSAFVFAASRGSQATLVVQAGQATVTRGGWLSAWTAGAERAVPAGEILVVKAGDQVSMGAGATAELRFLDGSNVVMTEDTRLVVQELDTSQDTYRVRLQQLGGVTLNRVIHLLGVGEIFEIQTPSSTVSVRGTEFTVAVQSAERTWVGVTKGVVHVVMGDQAVDVHPGEQVQGQVGQPLQVQPQDGTGPVVVPVAPTMPGSSPAAPGSTQPAAVSTPAVPSQAAPTTGATDGPTGGGSGSTTGGVSATEQPSTNPQVSPAGGPPAQVPGSPPSSVSGNGNPPTGGGEAPGQSGKDNPNNKEDKDDNSGKGNNKSK